MKYLSLLFITLNVAFGCSQNTTQNTTQNVQNDSILMLNDLQRKLDELEKKEEALYNALIGPHKCTGIVHNSNKVYQSKKEFDRKYVKLLNIDCLPNSLPIDNIRKDWIVGYGEKMHPVYKVEKFHKGIDIPSLSGTNVKATISGYVDFSLESNRGYGNQLMLKTEKNIKVFYAHLDTFYFSTGDYIEKGEIIGKVGNTGLSTKDHLHYEIIINDEHINPIFTVFEIFNEMELESIFTENCVSYD